MAFPIIQFNLSAKTRDAIEQTIDTADNHLDAAAQAKAGTVQWEPIKGNPNSVKMSLTTDGGRDEFYRVSGEIYLLMAKTVFKNQSEIIVSPDPTTDGGSLSSPEAYNQSGSFKDGIDKIILNDKRFANIKDAFFLIREAHDFSKPSAPVSTRDCDQELQDARDTKDVEYATLMASQKADYDKKLADKDIATATKVTEAQTAAQKDEEVKLLRAKLSNWPAPDKDTVKKGGEYLVKSDSKDTDNYVMDYSLANRKLTLTLKDGFIMGTHEFVLNTDGTIKTYSYKATSYAQATDYVKEGILPDTTIGDRLKAMRAVLVQDLQRDHYSLLPTLIAHQLELLEKGKPQVAIAGLLEKQEVPPSAPEATATAVTQESAVEPVAQPAPTQATAGVAASSTITPLLISPAPVLPLPTFQVPPAGQEVTSAQPVEQVPPITAAPKASEDPNAAVIRHQNSKLALIRATFMKAALENPSIIKGTMKLVFEATLKPDGTLRLEFLDNASTPGLANARLKESDMSFPHKVMKQITSGFSIPDHSATQDIKLENITLILEKKS